ncbi:SKP1-like protein 1B [Impatiens glandulifera]|uniref:SKP1-like protein 1B n=1 Tax=Impatiens glandulifera TaxID=253017 RepID=UPI001FB0B55F|nr:SKP1-like protein 1B [Impatiens glandulifera]
MAVVQTNYKHFSQIENRRKQKMSNFSNPKMVKLRSSDGIYFPVLKRVALMSKTLKKIIEQPMRADDVIPLNNIDAKILSMVMKYCARHSCPPDAEQQEQEEEEEDKLESLDLEILKCDDQNLKDLHFEFMKNEKLRRFDSEFLKNLDREELLSLGIAAKHLDVHGLSLIVYKKHAETLKDMPAEEISQYFGMKTTREDIDDE